MRLRQADRRSWRALRAESPRACAEGLPARRGAIPAIRRSALSRRALVFGYAVCIGNHSFERQPLGRLQASVGFADENAESNGQKRATIIRRSGLQGFRWAFKFKEKYRVVVGAE